MKRAETQPFAMVIGSELKITRLGREIQKLIHHFYEIEPHTKVLQYVIMPDHIHILLFVENEIPEKLGYYIARWKIFVNKSCGIDSVFETGFNDQILKSSRSLKVLINYIRDNPRRLIVRKLYPHYFRRVNRLKIGDKFYQAYGNVQLLENPFKEQVVVHRADTEEMRRRNRDLWLYTAANGGVLVSPFISPAEKAIRSEAEALNGKIILITNETFPERYKPSTHDFNFCELGRLLIIALTDSISFSRSSCLTMNTLASTISAS